MGREFNANHSRQWSSHIRDNAGDVGDALLDCPDKGQIDMVGKQYQHLHVYILYVKDCQSKCECIQPKYVKIWMELSIVIPKRTPKTRGKSGSYNP